MTSGPTGFQLRYAAHLGLRGPDAPLFKASVGSADPFAQVDYIADQGFAGVQDLFMVGRPAAEQARLGEAIGGRGLEMGSIVHTFDMTNLAWISEDEAACARIDHEVARSLEAAGRAGARLVVVSPARDVARPIADQQAVMARHLRRLGPMAERAGVTLCLEPLSEHRVPGMILHNLADGQAVVRAADSPAVKLVFDFLHVQMMDGGLLHNLDRCWDDIALIQIADAPDRSELGTGELNWVTLLRAVRDHGYEGLLEYEIYPSRPGAAGEQAALAALRDVDGRL